MKICKRILCLAAALMMLCLTASAESTREEIIYARLHFDGTNQEIYAVNALESDQEQVLTDAGQYEDLINLTSSEKIVPGEFKVPAGMFYYSGRLDSAILPWKITVSFALNGAQVSAEDLAGASGEVKIHLAVEKEAMANPIYFESCVLQISVSLDREKCLQITSDQATMANAGGKRQLTFMLLPGSEASFDITCQAQNFSMDGITIAGIPMTLPIDENSFDLAPFTGQLTQLQSAVNSLDQGADALSAGLETLSAQNNALQSAAEAMMNAAFDQVNAALAQQFSASGTKIPTLTPENYQKVLEQLAAGMKQASSALESVRKQLDDAVAFYQGISNYLAGVSQSSAGAGQLAEGLGQLASQTGGMDEAVQSQVTLLLKSFAAPESLPSFVSAENGEVRSVQFVLSTDGISVPRKDASSEPEPAPASFWDRLISLFS